MDDKTILEALEAIKANSAAILKGFELLGEKLSNGRPAPRRTVQLEDAAIRDAGELPEDWRKYVGGHKPPLGPAKTDEEKLARAIRSARFFTALVVGDHAALKAMGEATDPTGGYLVPEEFRAEVILKQQVLPVLRNVARVWPMGRDRVNIPAESARISVAWEGENVAWTASDATMANIALAVNRLDGFTSVSRELLADSAVSVMDMLSQMYAEALGLEEDKQFVVGNGVGKPLGIESTVGIGTVAQAGGSLAYSDFVELYYTLGRQYRQGAIWLMRDANVKKAAKLLDSNGRPIFENLNTPPSGVPGGGASLPRTGTILGLPVYSQDDASATKIHLFNPRYYFIGDRGDMGAEMTTIGAGAFEKHQAALKVWRRVDGRVAMTDAFKTLTGVA